MDPASTNPDNPRHNGHGQRSDGDNELALGPGDPRLGWLHHMDSDPLERGKPDRGEGVLYALRLAAVTAVIVAVAAVVAIVIIGAAQVVAADQQPLPVTAPPLPTPAATTPATGTQVTGTTTGTPASTAAGPAPGAAPDGFPPFATMRPRGPGRDTAGTELPHPTSGGQR